MMPEELQQERTDRHRQSAPMARPRAARRDDEAILMLTPTGRDADLVAARLEEHGMQIEICTDIADLCRRIKQGAGAAMIAREALDVEGLTLLNRTLDAQGAWSDFPLVILQRPGGGEEGHGPADASGLPGNATLIERPVGTVTLMSALQIALRARRRQYEMRAHLARQVQQVRALRESDDRFRLAINASPITIFQQDRKLRYTWIANPAEAFDSDEIVRRTDSDLLGPEAANRLTVLKQTVLETGQGVRQVVSTTWGGTERRSYDLTLEPLRDEDGTIIGLSGAAVDITERQRAEEELAQYRQRLEELVIERSREVERTHEQLRLSERQASLGTLASGIGHDLGNMLLPLRCRLDSMEGKIRGQGTGQRQWMDVVGDLLDDLDSIRRSADYVQDLSSGLRLLMLDSEDALPGSEVTDLREWWPHIQGLMRNVVPKHVPLETDFADGLPCICLARHRLTQVVFNLVQNSADALRDRVRGRIVFRAERAEDAIRLSVSDNGPGMTEEVRQRCLEPFFTSKMRSVSTGMGLSLVHGIVHKAGGALDIDSAPDVGTTITVSLPAALPSESPSSGPGEELTAVVTLTDPRIRTFVMGLVRSLGFDVEHADEPTPGTNLWIVESGRWAASTAGRFLDVAEHRRVIRFGTVIERQEPGPRADGDPSRQKPRPGTSVARGADGEALRSDEESSQIIALEENPSAATIRRTLHEVAARLKG